MARASKLSQVLEEASALFASHGFNATSLEAVAEGSKITKTGLYYHIRGKEDLLSQICMQSIEGIMAGSGGAENCPDPLERLRTIIKTHAEFVMRNPHKVRVLQHERIHLSRARRAAVLKIEKRYFTLVRRAIDDGQRAGRLRRVDSGIAALTFIGGLNALGEWYKPDGRLQPAQVIAELTAFLLNGLLRPENIRK
jgi:TetR/AcrR family transcriptional regulator, cholesterol catabolism regulator